MIHNVTKIQRIDSGLVKIYNQSYVIGAFSGLKTLTIGYENGRPITINFVDSLFNVFSFYVYNLTTVNGKDKDSTWIPIDPSDTSGAYETKVYEVYDFLCDFIYTAPTEINITDSAGDIINPAQDETIILLRRIAKLLEPIGTQDSLQRQRITIGSSETTVSTNPSTMASVDTRFMIADWARTAYNTGIRAKLT
jgi:hypothetical protein